MCSLTGSLQPPPQTIHKATSISENAKTPARSTIHNSDKTGARAATIPTSACRSICHDRAQPLPFRRSVTRTNDGTRTICRGFTIRAHSPRGKKRLGGVHNARYPVPHLERYVEMHNVDFHARDPRSAPPTARGSFITVRRQRQQERRRKFVPFYEDRQRQAFSSLGLIAERQPGGLEQDDRSTDTEQGVREAAADQSPFSVSFAAGLFRARAFS